MGSTCALCSSDSGGRADPEYDDVSSGPVSPVFQPHGSRRCHVRPWDRKRVQNAPNWNQRTYSSPVNSGVGTKPPISVPQYGIPLRHVLTVSATCVRSVSHVEYTSPDHRNAP